MTNMVIPPAAAQMPPAANASSSSVSAASAMSIANRPTFVEHGSYRFVIMDAPTDSNLPAYIEQLKRFKVETVVRACEPTYSSVPLKQANIDVLELPFTDGDPPPAEVVNDWLDLVDNTFSAQSSSSVSSKTPDSSEKKQKKDVKAKEGGAAIAVHCVAGLGRAPVLVAIALIEKGMEPYDAIEFIRKKRRGAINARQLSYLEQYRRRRRSGGCSSCIIC